MQDTLSKTSKIAVLCGGMSTEREVSLRSGKNCYEALKRLGYVNAQLVVVDNNIAQILKGYDYAYNALHGKYGEDGCIQGLLEIMKIPYTGCGVMSSAICMNKEYTKRVLKNYDIPLIKSVFITSDFKEDIKAAVNGLKYPLMVKPVCEGSSFGMSKVNSPDELTAAYNDAVKYNPDVLIEEYREGISATVGVLEKDGEVFATEVLEFRPKNEWYDYEAKYTKGMTEFILPAQISDELTQKVKDITIKSFKACRCSGVARVDFLISDGVPYVLEINTSPGMTDTSDLPAQSAACGIGFDELVELILKSAGLNK